MDLNWEKIIEIIQAFDPEYLIEIFLIYLVIYIFLRFMEGTRGEGILKGIALVLLIVPMILSILSNTFGVLHRMEVILKFFGAAAIPALVVIVQPELRRALVRVGQTRFFGFIFKGQTESIVDEIVKATFRMSRRNVGALIAIEREVGLKNYIERGTKIDGLVTSQLLATIFFPGSELHDGAIVIRNDRIAAGGCLFPLSENPDISKTLGTRHRAALGITEETDAVVVVVSEESGTVSFTHDGKLEQGLNPDQLREELLKYYAQLEERQVEIKREELEELEDRDLLRVGSGEKKEGDSKTNSPRSSNTSHEKAEV